MLQFELLVYDHVIDIFAFVKESLCKVQPLFFHVCLLCFFKPITGRKIDALILIDGFFNCLCRQLIVNFCYMTV